MNANPGSVSEQDPFSPAASSPLPCFLAWFVEAKAAESNDPDAMALATATPNGRPSVRMVLLKEVGNDASFVFYTNRESRKGVEICANPRGALCFHWKSLRRQVRIEGPLSEVSADQADAYFRTRPRGSRLGAWASDQSRPLSNRHVLMARMAELERRYPEEVPRPSHWTGFVLFAESMEFWRGGHERLHERMLYIRTATGWTRRLLYP